MASGVTVAYNGNVIHQMPSNGTFKMNTANAYMEGDIDVVVDVDSGSSATLISKAITQNGTYNASDDNADGYDEVTVSVPNTYSASDEGKVVDGGALVQQGSQTVTENGIYDTTLFSGLTVNVSGGGITPSGSININENGIYDVVDFASAIVSVPQGGGDGTIGASVAIGGEVGSFYSPTISSIREYAFYYCSNLTEASFPSCKTVGSRAFYFCSSLTSVSFPNCSYIGDFAFHNCRITQASFPSCKTIGSSAFQSCTSLTNANFPSCTAIYGSAFQSCSRMTQASFPMLSFIGANAFRSCSRLTDVSLPNCSTIGSSAFYGCSSLSQVYLFGSQRVVLSTSAFVITPMSNSSYLGYFGSIYVPASLYDAYISATNWSLFSARIVSLTSEEIEAL